MSNPLDTDAGTERYSNYEAELKLVEANLTQKLDQIPELSGEPRKAAVSASEGLLEEARELLGSMRLEKSSIPTASRQKINASFRNHETDIDGLSRRIKSLASSRAQLFGSRYTDEEPSSGSGDAQLEQRQQLLSGTDRLQRSSNRLRDTQRVANETEQIGASTLADLHQQRETITRTRDTLLESEGYTDRSLKTLKGMARRMATNRIVTIAIITILVILIIAVIVSKFR